MLIEGGLTAHCRGVLNQRSRALTAAERGPVWQLFPSPPPPQSSADAAALPHTSKRAHAVQPALAAWCKYLPHHDRPKDQGTAHSCSRRLSPLRVAVQCSHWSPSTQKQLQNACEIVSKGLRNNDLSGV
jgi:hypothetical protein